MLEIPANNLDSQRKYFTQLNYLLYLVSALLFFTSFIAITINYLKLSEVKGTYYESHFHWQIRTFWISLIGTVLGMLTAPIMIGWFVILITIGVVVYRAIKGWLVLNRGQALVG
jgi:uncharacterized membrane protein